MEFLENVASAALGCIIGCPIGFWIGARLYGGLYSEES
jgi:membrane protein DedA with SNARE-associated domain